MLDYCCAACKTHLHLSTPQHVQRTVWACWQAVASSHQAPAHPILPPVLLRFGVPLAARSERKLAAVKVVQEDIDALAVEAEVDKKAAERRLREHDGNLVAALKSYM